MDTTIPGLAEVITFGGASIFVGILFQALKWAWSPTPEVLTRWGPLVSLGLGIVCGVGFALYQGQDPVAGGLVGFFAGASASGLYGSAKSAVAFATQ